ncbi:hypothetical protein AnigIFM63309_009520, partial [Aspergillus niger]
VVLWLSLPADHLGALYRVTEERPSNMPAPKINTVTIAIPQMHVTNYRKNWDTLTAIMLAIDCDKPERRRFHHPMIDSPRGISDSESPPEGSVQMQAPES